MPLAQHSEWRNRVFNWRIDFGSAQANKYLGPAYLLLLASVALGYSLGYYYYPSDHLLDTIPILKRFSLSIQRLLVAVLAIALLIGLTFILYKPFADWYALGYTKVAIWGGPRTPFNSYLVHWGLFLFVIVSWLLWEARDWMAHTPVSALNKLRPFAGIIATLAGILFIMIVLLGIKVSGLENLPFGRGNTDRLGGLAPGCFGRDSPLKSTIGGRAEIHPVLNRQRISS